MGASQSFFSQPQAGAHPPKNPLADYSLMLAMQSAPDSKPFRIRQNKPMSVKDV